MLSKDGPIYHSKQLNLFITQSVITRYCIYSGNENAGYISRVNSQRHCILQARYGINWKVNKEIRIKLFVYSSHVSYLYAMKTLLLLSEVLIICPSEPTRAKYPHGWLHQFSDVNFGVSRNTFLLPVDYKFQVSKSAAGSQKLWHAYNCIDPCVYYSAASIAMFNCWQNTYNWCPIVHLWVRGWSGCLFKVQSLNIFSLGCPLRVPIIYWDTGEEMICLQLYIDPCVYYLCWWLPGTLSGMLKWVGCLLYHDHKLYSQEIC